jgi:hypothetical protein
VQRCAKRPDRRPQTADRLNSPTNPELRSAHPPSTPHLWHSLWSQGRPDAGRERSPLPTLCPANPVQPNQSRPGWRRTAMGASQVGRGICTVTPPGDTCTCVRCKFKSVRHRTTSDESDLPLLKFSPIYRAQSR